MFACKQMHHPVAAQWPVAPSPGIWLPSGNFKSKKSEQTCISLGEEKPHMLQWITVTVTNYDLKHIYSPYSRPILLFIYAPVQSTGNTILWGWACRGLTQGTCIGLLFRCSLALIFSILIFLLNASSLLLPLNSVRSVLNLPNQTFSHSYQGEWNIPVHLIHIICWMALLQWCWWKEKKIKCRTEHKD